VRALIVRRNINQQRKTMKKRLLASLVTGLFVFGESEMAHAALIASDWKNVGDNAITLDTNSGLKWLDINQTTGLSYNQVLAELAPSGIFGGFRFATNSEVESLFTSIGFATPFNTWRTSDGIPAATLQNYFGVNQSFINPSNQLRMNTNGFTGELFTPTEVQLYEIWSQDTDDFGRVTIIGGSFEGLNDLDTQSPRVGAWLIVPEPSSMLLFGMSMIGLAGFRHRMRE
jgi:hypothetical protein